ncbi:MAG TPA: signal recognition particle-docking protein FtsY [Candidatus Dormibacteraeota bacterium]
MPEGLWNRVAARTRRLFTEGLGTPLEPGFYDSLEERLLAGDLGPQLAAAITAGVREQKPSTLEHAQAALAAQVTMAMHPGTRALRLEAKPSCLLFYGVNGAGKTTTVGKLAHRLKAQGLRPLIVAADTYRAAGIEQMQAWAERAGVESFAGKPGGDPAAAVFDALQMAASRGHDAVLVDTAGRLQTQHNLLQELAKIARVAGRAQEGAPHEALLVLDAALGQSTIAQARGFASALPLTGLVLAKLDGSAKGGAVLAVESELGVPVKLAGVGEAIDDLVEFDPQAFAQALFAA